ncbi:related to phytase [Cephalotrichum gorgonifer]|uniref:3-phytase n=1 Tax=Cephalotrichum gorgonifer TaxID=2041049 RepID=A0AAE8MQW4_9PEZI|nr:related to phytase [Cephalotrichum gorgonifer]
MPPKSAPDRAEYELVGQADAAQDQDADAEGSEYAPSRPAAAPAHPKRAVGRRTAKAICVGVAACFVVFVVFQVISNDAIARLRGSIADAECPCRAADVPLHFQTSPQVYPGPTATGAPAFLAQTAAFEPEATYVPNEPLRTSMPIEGMGKNESIFRHMGYLSPYFPSPGFGVDEYPLPPGAEIVQVQMLSRHGARYPEMGSRVEAFGKRISDAQGTFNVTGSLAFLRDWKYQLGAEILVPKGRQELYDSGVLHSYMYSKLYDPNTKIIARTTTQDRMLKSAENFMAGFFGLEWTNNATLEVIIEQDGFNNSLAGYINCPNNYKDQAPREAAGIWAETYLQDAMKRFQGMTQGFDWTIKDTYAAQMMCPYETVAYGYSVYCDLFTYEEWVGFGYSTDIVFNGGNGFQSPTGRAVGLGYQQEVMARLKNQTLSYSHSQINVTLDSSTDTFPLNQSLYFDFSHDTNIASVLTAFGLRQFSQFLDPTEYPGPHNATVSHMTPFAARLDIEVIRAPLPLSADRESYLEGEETRYVHFVLNQRTVPLGLSHPECDAARVDGWCELHTFIRVQERMAKLARFDEACFGDYLPLKYGDVTDGAPP